MTINVIFLLDLALFLLLTDILRFLISIPPPLVMGVCCSIDSCCRTVLVPFIFLFLIRCVMLYVIHNFKFTFS